MTTIVKVIYTAQGSPDTVMTFDLTGIDIENIKKRTTTKKERTSIRMDDNSTKVLDYRLNWLSRSKCLLKLYQKQL